MTERIRAQEIMESDEYKVSTDLSLMNFDLIHSNLVESYWAKDIPREVVAKSMENSLCFGAFDAEGSQVAFARVVTDYATFAYIGDVFVLETCRGRGIGKLLMRSVMKHAELQGLRRMMLATHDAHGLYEQYGFTPLANSERLMELCEPGLYSRKS